jgi:hypothetical protein
MASPLSWARRRPRLPAPRLREKVEIESSGHQTIKNLHRESLAANVTHVEALRRRIEEQARMR